MWHDTVLLFSLVFFDVYKGYFSAFGRTLHVNTRMLFCCDCKVSVCQCYVSVSIYFGFELSLTLMIVCVCSFIFNIVFVITLIIICMNRSVLHC